MKESKLKEFIEAAKEFIEGALLWGFAILLVCCVIFAPFIPFQGWCQEKDRVYQDWKIQASDYIKKNTGGEDE